MTTYRLVFSARGQRDLLAARRWLSQPGSGLRARLKMARINRQLSELEFAPFRWALNEHGDAREFSVEGYRVVNRIDETQKCIRVLRIFSPFQDRSTA